VLGGGGASTRLRVLPRGYSADREAGNGRRSTVTAAAAGGNGGGASA
jgi:hypothetical protein